MEKSLSYAAPSGLYVTPKHQPGPGPHGAGVPQTQKVSHPQQQGDQAKHRGRNLQVGCAWRPAASHKGTHSLQPRWQHKHRTKLRTDPDQHQTIASPACQQSSTALAAEALLGASLKAHMQGHGVIPGTQTLSTEREAAGLPFRCQGWGENPL